ncbi:SH3 domain-containing protein [Sphingomonas canadensis]|uniref:SH3 domain-containing protein n=1 Tax=Sphingomonas canadensis TaxID=1219257 RepID=A0ABW3H7N8_9SPHN|nr:SH3 domain-containing protein [Sphingomonas canadensis]
MRLAGSVFAPHYAAPLPRKLARGTALRAESAAGSPTVAQLGAGDTFEVLEFAGTHAWGVAPGAGRVGYIDADALAADDAA